jgi:hypothetical protein
VRGRPYTVVMAARHWVPTRGRAAYRASVVPRFEENRMVQFCVYEKARLGYWVTVRRHIYEGSR